jgi:hypothetical protein
MYIKKGKTRFLGINCPVIRLLLQYVYQQPSVWSPWVTDACCAVYGLELLEPGGGTSLITCGFWGLGHQLISEVAGHRIWTSYCLAIPPLPTGNSTFQHTRSNTGLNSYCSTTRNLTEPTHPEWSREASCRTALWNPDPNLYVAVQSLNQSPSSELKFTPPFGDICLGNCPGKVTNQPQRNLTWNMH